jgi:hypothetical protein
MKSMFETSDQVPTSACGDNTWAIRNPLHEARDLHKMVVYGSALADRYPKEQQRIRSVLQFRRNAAREFERLVNDDVSFNSASQTQQNIGELELSLNAQR